MSVINQMLNDIEQREKSQQQAQTSQQLDYLQVNEPKQRKTLMIVAAIVLFSLSAAWVAMSAKSSDESGAAIPIEGNDVAKTDVGMPNSDKTELPQSVPELAVKQPPTESLSGGPEAPQALVTENKSSDDTVNILQRESAVPRLEQSNVAKQNAEENEVKPVIKSAEKIDKKSELSITTVQVTGRELAKLKYQQGLKQQQSGAIAQAQIKWREALTADPSFHLARESLAASFYGARRTQDALAVLNQAVIIFPTYENYRMLKAQILFKQQKPAQALAALNNPFTNSKSSDEALALAGSIAQSLSLWPDAERNYRLLNQRQPSNGNWLISLAISLDGQGKTSEAIAFYQQFILLPGNTQALNSYAKQRLKQLNSK